MAMLLAVVSLIDGWPQSNQRRTSFASPLACIPPELSVRSAAGGLELWNAMSAFELLNAALPSVLCLEGCLLLLAAFD